MGVMGGSGCSGTQPSTQYTSGGNTSKANVICQSAVDGATADDKLALSVNGMMCSVWRNFQLDAYSRGSFGRSFSKMDVEDEKIKKAIEATGLSGDDFCVPLKSSGSAQDYFDKHSYLMVVQTTRPVTLWPTSSSCALTWNPLLTNGTRTQSISAGTR